MYKSYQMKPSAWWELANRTADKLQFEAVRKEPNLHRLVLLCNTYDERMSHYPSDTSDCDSQSKGGLLEMPPPYELYCSPGVEVSVEECDSSSSDDSSSDEDEDEDEYRVMVSAADQNDNSDWLSSGQADMDDDFKTLERCPQAIHFTTLSPQSKSPRNVFTDEKLWKRKQMPTALDQKSGHSTAVVVTQDNAMPGKKRAASPKLRTSRKTFAGGSPFSIFRAVLV